MLEPGTIEGLVVAILVAVLMWPLVRAAPRGSSRALLQVAGVVVPVAVAWAAITLRALPPPEHEVQRRPLALQEDGFVSSDACRSCHPREYETWHGSYHRTMTQVVSPATVVGDFDDVQLTLDGTAYHLKSDGGEFWVESETPPAEGEEASTRTRRRVVLSTGSHHEQDYWLESTDDDRRLEMFPFVWSRRENRWVPFRDVFLAPPGAVEPEFDGLWNYTCMDCHTTRPQSRIRSWADRDNEHDARVTEFGIACEACHGPAAKHVALNQNPLRRFSLYLTDDGDDSIVNPARLDHARASQVCGSCHGIFVKKGRLRMDPDSRVPSLLTGWDPDPWVPGDDIEDTRVWLRAAYFDPEFDDPDPERRKVIEDRLENGFDFEGNFWSDGMVRISGREYSGLIESPCFQRGEIECGSCHRLHKAGDDPRTMSDWADDQLEVGMAGNRACVSCHGEYAAEERLVAHTHHGATSEGSRCYNCHMPHTVYGVQKAIRSHQIDSPSVAATVATGRPDACNLCHLDKTVRWAAERLQSWYGIPMPRLLPSHNALAAGAMWAIQGDAGQRALVAWSMGWEPALEASGADWTTPILVALLTDPYSSVRAVAMRSLKKRAEYRDFAYDFTVPGALQAEAAQKAMDLWDASRGAAPSRAPVELLQRVDGGFDTDRAAKLARWRNNRPVVLHE